MKSGRRPTRKEKQFITKHRLKVDNWLVTKAPPGELHIINRDSRNVRVLKVG
ncbi:MAG: hypothetical protein SCK28_01580 [Bacillota bacterium]|nr:hypothetical protein [Bacillota bacterium]